MHTSRLIVWKIARASRESRNGEVPATVTYYGCAPPHGQARDRSSGIVVEETSRITRLISAGSCVAATEAAGGKSGSRETLTVRDVSRGATFRITLSEEASDYEGAGEEQALPELESLGSPVGVGMDGLALDARGDVAWVGRTESSSEQPQQLVLYLHDRRGTREVAVGQEITGLDFRDSMLMWRSAGLAQSTQA